MDIPRVFHSAPELHPKPGGSQEGCELQVTMRLGLREGLQVSSSNSGVVILQVFGYSKIFRSYCYSTEELYPKARKYKSRAWNCK